MDGGDSGTITRVYLINNPKNGKNGGWGIAQWGSLVQYVQGPGLNSQCHTHVHKKIKQRKIKVSFNLF